MIPPINNGHIREVCVGVLKSNQLNSPIRYKFDLLIYDYFMIYDHLNGVYIQNLWNKNLIFNR